MLRSCACVWQLTQGFDLLLLHAPAREFQDSEKIDFSQQGKVPVIVDRNKRGKWVNDSWAIAKYLEATYPDRPSLFGGKSGTC